MSWFSNLGFYTEYSERNDEVSNTVAIEILVNGEPCTVPAGQSLPDLLRYLEIDPSRVAVELNRRIIRKAQWADTTVEAGARLEIVQFVGGG